MSLQKSVLASNLLTFYIFLIGLCIGSFVNVVAFRIPKMMVAPFLSLLFFLTGQFERVPRKENLLFPSSYCPACQHPLSWIDLIPFFGFFLRRGKCSYCSTPIAWQYPLVELATGLLYLLAFRRFGISFSLLSALYLIPMLLAVFLIDWRTTLIPDRITYTSLLIGFLFCLKTIGWQDALLGSLLGFGIFYGIALFSIYIYPKKEGMGWGDIKLAAVLGAFFGVKGVIVIVYLSFLIGGALAIFLIGLRMKSRSDVIPFGPAMVVASLLTLFFSPSLFSLYNRLILP